MVARQNFVAWFVTSRSVTNLVASLVTAMMAAIPRTKLTTWHAQLATLPSAFTVYATVFTTLGTWWAWHTAGLSARVRTNQHAATLQFASHVHSTLSTFATCSRARVTTFQIASTRDWALCRCGKASCPHGQSRLFTSSVHSVVHGLLQ